MVFVMASQSKDFDHQRLLPRTLEDLLMGWIGRLSGAVLLVFCAGLWLALLTWSASDPSLSTSSAVSPSNIFGWLGAVLADLLLQTVGLSCVLLIVCLQVWALQLLLAQHVDRFWVREGRMPFMAAVILVVPAL